MRVRLEATGLEIEGRQHQSHTPDTSSTRQREGMYIVAEQQEARVVCQAQQELLGIEDRKQRIELVRPIAQTLILKETGGDRDKDVVAILYNEPV